MIDRLIEFSAKNRALVFITIGFLVFAGLYSMRTMPLDAIPDLSDTQVIVYSRWDRSPDIMEDQVTYPIVTSMLGAPRVKSVRGFSDFGYSFVYIIFDEGTDLYWARTRTLEYLSGVLPRLPAGVQTELGPDATGVGWVFQYVLVDSTGKRSLAELRTLQDWFLRYQLKSVPGVAEVAPLGGFVRQYQVQVDPSRLQAFNMPIMDVVDAVRKGNNDVGGRLVELSGAEYMVRGRGYARTTADIGDIVLRTSASGAPVRVRDIGTVTLGPDLRRGLADWNGEGDAVAGIVVMRQGENALDVIERVKAKIVEIQPGLPEGVTVVSAYDRSELILRSIENLKSTLIEEVVIVSFIIMLFLWHIPSAIIPVFTIPIAIIIAFIPMRMMGVSSNIMSLGGIAIAVGAMVDAAIVVVEQTHKKLEEWQRNGRKEDYHRVVIDAVKEVGGPSFFALLVIAVAFLPVLALEGQEGRLFKPLAYTKNLSMIVAAVLAITLDPAMRLLFTRVDPWTFRPKWLARVVNAVLVGTIHSEERHPISRILIGIYDPICWWVLRWRYLVIAGAIAMVVATVPVYQRLGSEFMPPLDEGTLLFMPSTLAGPLGDRGAAVDAGPEPHHQELPGSGDRVRQVRPRRDLDRPGAALHDGDGDRPQAARPMAPGDDVVLGVDVAPGVGARGPAAHHARSAQHAAVGRADEPGAATAGGLERLDDADQGPHRHADDGDPDAGRASRSTAPTSARSSASAPRSSASCRRWPARAASLPSAPVAGTSSTSTGTARRLPATASASTMRRRS